MKGTWNSVLFLQLFSKSIIISPKEVKTKYTYYGKSLLRRANSLVKGF